MNKEGVVCFTNKVPSDQVMLVNQSTKVQVHSGNGKMLDTLQGNLYHKLEIRKSEVNTKQGLVMTLSNDLCVLWSTTQNQPLYKQR